MLIKDELILANALNRHHCTTSGAPEDVGRCCMGVDQRRVVALEGLFTQQRPLDQHHWASGFGGMLAPELEHVAGERRGGGSPEGVEEVQEPLLGGECQQRVLRDGLPPDGRHSVCQDDLAEKDARRADDEEGGLRGQGLVEADQPRRGAW